MKCLAIDVGGRALSGALAVFDSGQARLLGSFCLDTGKNHSLALLPMVDAMLDNLGLRLSDCDGFAVTAGPGSFTGLRIGLATVQGWQLALDKPAVALPSTEVALRAADRPGLVCPIFDARRSEVYAAVFRDGERISEDLAITPADLATFLEQWPEEPVSFIGDGVAPWAEQLAELLGDRFQPMRAERCLNLAPACAMLGLERLLTGQTTPPETMLPLYLRRSEAEEKRLQQGLPITV